jgi:predicted transcriptional regulator
MNALSETVELADQVGMHVPQVRDFMTKSLITLSPNEDVFVAIDHILAKRFSGAPVLDEQGTFLGIFSEKTAMRVLICAAYDQQPGAKIGAYINTDLRRVIHDGDSLIEISQKFQRTPYRRLPVLNNQQLVGQVSRRDVIRSEHRLTQQVANESKRAGSDARLQDCNFDAVVGTFIDANAKTITSSDDILSIAQIFLNTPYRRLAVVESGSKLVGQVSRRDLLSAAAASLRPKQHRKASTLYISPLTDSVPPSIG